MKPPSRPTGRPAAILAIVAVLFAVPAEGRGQGVPASYGFIAGTTAGAYVSTGIFVARARMGSYIYSMDDALSPRWELVPAVAMPIGGVVLGLEDEQRLASSIAWGGAGFLVGAAVGLGVGELLGDTSQGRWAGFIIGSAAGLLAGSVYGAATYAPPEPAAASRAFRASPRHGGAPAGLTIRIRL